MKGLFKRITAAAAGTVLAAAAAFGGAVSTYAAEEISHIKSISGNETDGYTLSLNVTAKDKVETSSTVSTVTTNGHADIVLVMDRTFSMSATLDDGSTRFAAVQEAAKTFISGLENDADSHISLVSYQCYDSSSRTTPVYTDQAWTSISDSSRNTLKNTVSNLTLTEQTYGYDTYYNPPLERVYSLLNESDIKNDGNNKYVIFFSDGEASDSYSATLDNIKNISTVFSVGVKPKYFYESIDKIKSVASDTDKFFEVSDAASMSAAFNSALLTIQSETVSSETRTAMSDVTISDTLSPYVELNGTPTLTASDGSSVDVSINGTTATIGGELKDGVTYTLNIPVKPSQAARDAANASSEAASSFKTNDAASLTYSYGDETKTLDYAQMPEITITKEAQATPASDTSFELTKTLKINSADKRVPNAEFEFSAESSNADAPAITIDKATFTEADEIDAEKKVSKKVNVNVPAAADFPAAGTYEYTIKETPDTYTGEGDMTYDSSEYKLTVKVCSTADGLTYDDAGGAHITLVKADAPDAKLESIEFNNEYNKEVKTEILTVSKTVAGDHADKNKEFIFTVSFTDPGNVGDVKPVKDGSQIEYGTDCTFTLKDGANVTFTVPVGTEYTITESGSESYEAKAVISSGDIQENKNGSAGADLSVSSQIAEGENKADFTNTYVDNPLTGITNGRGPLFIIIPAAIAGVVLLALGKRRSKRA